MTEEQELLQTALRASWAVVRRLRSSQVALLPHMPVSLETVASEDTEFEVQADAMIKRVEQLQDIIERRVVRGLLLSEGEAVREMSARDRMDRTEALLGIALSERWTALVKMRNELAHEYPLQPERQAKRINAAFGAIETLIGMLQGLTDYAVSRALVDATGLGEKGQARS